MERAAHNSLSLSRPYSKIVIATHDAQVMRLCEDAVAPVCSAVMSLTEVGLPEPTAICRHTRDTAIARATLVAMLCNLPAIGFARGFQIDPLLAFGGGGPKWSWLLPVTHRRPQAFSELRKANDRLTREGYLGPDDRGAYFECCVCLALPDGETIFGSARMNGQLDDVGSHDKGRTANLFDSYFVPDGDERPLSARTPDRTDKYCDVTNAAKALLLELMSRH